MLGYFDNQRATEQSFNDGGWFLSGDLGQLDQKGCLKIVGRIKDLVIRGGHNIHPGPIESLAMRHDCVEKAAVVPVADDRLGEKACLVVTFTKGASTDASQLLSFLDAEGLSKYDMPEYFLLIDSFPLTASGKILKRSIVASIKSGELTPSAIRWKSQDQSFE